ncbi:kinase-like protein [Macrolepiota fuliginosa MF-IS2]|uniref:Kinase-like protein n=1 Tax=Macrolepiota fuliginosa MF-IS2 TaxID=1400762 RepID=A0A9P5XNT1_9AGAR|nr:kinase-like protein [Macrolepiota fuliginosa MF-IS2]
MEIASGLAYLHSNAVTHRDLRGANIFLAESRESGLRAVITNYDIPQIQVENNLLKSTERVRWMAPEILASPREAMRRPKEADIFAFGMTMLEIFSGDHPYCDKSDEDVIPAIIRCEIPQLPESMMRDDQAIAKFFTECTLLEPFRRPLALGAFRIATGIYEKGRDYSLAPVPTEDLLTLPERPDSQINHPPWSGSSRAGINILSQSSQSASQQPSINDLGRGLPSSPPLFIVEFKAGRTDLFYLMDSSLDIKVGDLVIVEADRGKDLGKIVNDTITIGQVEEWQVQRADNVESLNLTEGLGAGTAGSAAQGALQGKEINPKMILRKADLEQEATHVTWFTFSPRVWLISLVVDRMLAAKAHDETMALALCRSKVKAKKLPMEVIDAEYRWDRRKLTFYYVAGQKLDFRELVRELFRLYKTRIWMALIQSNSLAYRL